MSAKYNQLCHGLPDDCQNRGSGYGLPDVDRGVKARTRIQILTTLLAKDYKV